MRINGLNVDADAIGRGIYRIICDKGDEAIIAFGMVPSWAMDSLRPMLRDKIIAEAAKQAQCTAEDLAPYLDEDKVKRTLQDIEHQVVLGIYAAAHAAGKMIV